MPGENRLRETATILGLLPAKSDSLERHIIEFEKSLGVSGETVASKRFIAARADASDTCCSKMRWMSVGNPVLRVHMGGLPNSCSMRAKSGSRLRQNAQAALKVFRQVTRCGHRHLIQNNLG